MVYFVQAIEGGPIKIGTTANLDVRLKTLESIYGRPLAVLAIMEGGHDVEREIHARFNAHRFGRTEQFRPASELMAFIGRPLLACAGDVIEMPVRANSKTLFAVKGSEEWFEWLKQYADFAGVSMMSAIDLALKDKARRDGFPEAMPKRIARASE